MELSFNRREILFALTVASFCGVSSVVVDSQFSKASDDFALSLYSKITDGNDGNVIFSPASIQLVLSLLSFGAAGTTKDEILQGLKYPFEYTSAQIGKNYEAFIKSIKSSTYLKVANQLFLAQRYTIKTNFNYIAAKSFDSSTQNLNFVNSAQSADVINKWVEGKTNSKIKNLFAQDAFTNDTRLVIVNAIYFKGLWKDAFDSKNTLKRPFYLDETNTVSVDFMMMKKSIKFGYFEDLNAYAITLPYKNSDISMLFILPIEKTGLSILEESLQTVDLLTIVSKLKMVDVTAYIPKFKVETALDMKSILKSMDMNLMFTDNADFSELLTAKENLTVTKVVHKAFIEVNEEGTEAAAATGAEISAVSMGINFAADHPFFFAILNGDGVYFSGRVVKF